jgi:hypothetical protein
VTTNALVKRYFSVVLLCISVKRLLVVNSCYHAQKEAVFVLEKLSPGRKPRGGIAGSDRLPPIYASEEFVELVTNEATKLGMGISEFGREAFQYYIENRGAKRDDVISFDLNDRDMKELHARNSPSGHFSLLHTTPSFFNPSAVGSMPRALGRWFGL